MTIEFVVDDERIEVARLNPCSNGMTIESSCAMTAFLLRSLNPCSNGMTIECEARAHTCLEKRVLILVLMK